MTGGALGRSYYKTRQSLVPCSRALTSAHFRGLLLPGDFCPFSRHQGTLTIFDGVGDFAHGRSRFSSRGTLLTGAHGAHPRGLCSRALMVLIPGDFAHGRSRCSSQGTLLTGAHGAHPSGLFSRALTVLIPGDFAHGRSRCSSQGTLLIFE